MIQAKNKGYSDYQIEDEGQNQQSFANSFCVQKEKKIKLKLKKQRIYKRKKHGLWSNIQQANFLVYIQSNKQILQEKSLRRKNKIFREMSKFIKTRSSQQCRSHHQKYLIKFHSHQGIVTYLTEKIKGNFRSKSQSRYINFSEKKFQQKENQHIYRIFNDMADKKQLQIDILQIHLNKQQQKLSKTIQPWKYGILQKGQGYTIFQKNNKNFQIEILLDLKVFLI